MSLLPVQRADQLKAAPMQVEWLIEELWSKEAVGILGGQPKSCKSFMALDIAISVASGAPCLRKFRVQHPGCVLFFPAEDSLDIVRQRLDGICAAAQISLQNLPLHIITAPSLRLDLAADRQRLANTVQTLKPSLLILDPLIRLHQAQENDASQMAPLLSHLRQLQRRFHLAIMVVHHARKEPNSQRPGQALRGSSELHGWGDSNLYLRRLRDKLMLATEHRAAPGADNIALRLIQSDSALALATISPEADDSEPLDHSPMQRVRQALEQLQHPVSVKQLRKLCSMRTSTLCYTLAEMSELGLVSHGPNGYQLKTPHTHQDVSLPGLSIDPQGNGNGKHYLQTTH